MDTFEQLETPSYDQTVAAYVERDSDMNIDLDDDKFNKNIKKLGFSIDRDDIMREYRAHKRYHIMKATQENDEAALSQIINLEYEDYYQERYPLKFTKYTIIRAAFESGDKETYYRAFSHDELKYLGY